MIDELCEDYHYVRKFAIKQSGDYLVRRSAMCLPLGPLSRALKEKALETVGRQKTVHLVDSAMFDERCSNANEESYRNVAQDYGQRVFMPLELKVPPNHGVVSRCALNV